MLILAFHSKQHCASRPHSAASMAVDLYYTVGYKSTAHRFLHCMTLICPTWSCLGILGRSGQNSCSIARFIMSNSEK